jgi:hypothetical protein
MYLLKHRNAAGNLVASDMSAPPSDYTITNTITTGFLSFLSLLYRLSEFNLFPVAILIAHVQPIQISPITHVVSPSTFLPFRFLSYALTALCIHSPLQEAYAFHTHCNR